MTTLVQATGLTKKFGNFTAVDDISLTVPKGEVLGFLGPNGAGKTTTMRMITGFLQANAGTIEICGHSISEAPIEAKKHFGYLPEGVPLYLDMTPQQFLTFCGKTRGMKQDELNDRLTYVSEHLELEEIFNIPIETLSKGFKRRVGLAQAILHDPDVLILDEPTDGLDPVQKREVRELISKMAAEKAIIISTHILEEVEAICTRMIIIANGRILADGTPKDLLKKSTSSSLDDYFISLVTSENNTKAEATA